MTRRRSLRYRFRRLRRRMQVWWTRLLWAGVVVVAVVVAAVVVTAVAPGGGDAPSATDAPDGLAADETERLFLKRLNAERESRGLEPVTQRDTLSEMGQAHSADMATHEYVGHEQPDGTTIADRYRDRGLLPECRLPTGDGRVYPGAETAIRLPIEGLSTGTDTEQELARVLLDEWLASPGHRDVLLLAAADEAGLGVVSSDGTVYAALEVC